MADNQNFRKPLPKTALTEYKLRLTAPKVEGAQRRPSLAFTVVKNNPRITVRTEVEGDKNKGVANAPMDGQTAYTLIDILHNMKDLEPGKAIKIENKNHTYTNGERSKDLVVISTTLVGRDEEGRCFIGLVAPGVTPVKFMFTPGFYHTFSYKDGSAPSEAEISLFCARGYARLMENLLANVMDTHYMEPEPRPQNGGGGYGGGNRGGGYGGGNRNYGNKSSGGSGGHQGGNSGGGNSGGDGWDGANDDFPM